MTKEGLRTIYLNFFAVANSSQSFDVRFGTLNELGPHESGLVSNYLNTTN